MRLEACVTVTDYEKRSLCDSDRFMRIEVCVTVTGL
jgi:hypothetical protein